LGQVGWVMRVPADADPPKAQPAQAAPRP
jgi:hypothetical protein